MKVSECIIQQGGQRVFENIFKRPAGSLATLMHALNTGAASTGWINWYWLNNLGELKEHHPPPLHTRRCHPMRWKNSYAVHRQVRFPQHRSEEVSCNENFEGPLRDSYIDYIKKKNSQKKQLHVESGVRRTEKQRWRGITMKQDIMLLQVLRLEWVCVCVWQGGIEVEKEGSMNKAGLVNNSEEQFWRPLRENRRFHCVLICLCVCVCMWESVRRQSLLTEAALESENLPRLDILGGAVGIEFSLWVCEHWRLSGGIMGAGV